MFVRKRRYARTPGGFYLNDRRPDAELESGYLQVCESYRDDQGRPRQRVICSLDTRYSLKQQIIEATTNIENCKRNIASYENPKNWRDARRAHIELPAARKRLIGYEKKLDGLIMAKGGLGEDWVPDGWTAEAEAELLKRQAQFNAAFSRVMGGEKPAPAPIVCPHCGHEIALGEH